MGGRSRRSGGFVEVRFLLENFNQDLLVQLRAIEKVTVRLLRLRTEYLLDCERAPRFCMA